MLKGAGGGGGGGITIDTSTITGGTNTRVLFDDSGVVGESAGLTYVKASGTLSATVFSGAGTSLTGTAASLSIGGSAGSLSATLAVASGGTGLTTYTSGGIIYASAAGTLASSGALIQYGVVTGGGAGAAPYTTTGFTFGAATGQGLLIPAGTATTDVAALSVTRTNNNSAVVKGVEFLFTDTTSAAGFLPLNILGGASASTSLLSLSKVGLLAAPQFIGSPTASLYAYTANTVVGQDTPGMVINAVSGKGGYIDFNTNGVLQGELYSNAASFSILARASAYIIFGASGANTVGVTSSGFMIPNNVGLGISSTAAVGGTFRPVILGTAPTLASGGCTTPTAVTSNGTAAFSVGVGTSCSGSQPLVFTLPAATTGWQCNARNQTNPAGNSPAQSSTVSTTSVTITNYSRTLGTAAAWNDSDVVVVSCLGY